MMLLCRSYFPNCSLFSAPVLKENGQTIAIALSIIGLIAGISLVILRKDLVIAAYTIIGISSGCSFLIALSWLFRKAVLDCKEKRKEGGSSLLLVTPDLQSSAPTGIDSTVAIPVTSDDPKRPDSPLTEPFGINVADSVTPLPTAPPLDAESQESSDALVPVVKIPSLPAVSPLKSCQRSEASPPVRCNVRVRIEASPPVYEEVDPAMAIRNSIRLCAKFNPRNKRPYRGISDLSPNTVTILYTSESFQLIIPGLFLGTGNVVNLFSETSLEETTEHLKSKHNVGENCLELFRQEYTKNAIQVVIVFRRSKDPDYQEAFLQWSSQQSDKIIYDVFYGDGGDTWERYLEGVFKIIDQHRNANQNVLLYDAHGFDSAAYAAIAAYLIRTYQVSLEAALKKIEAERHQCVDSSFRTGWEEKLEKLPRLTPFS